MRQSERAAERGKRGEERREIQEEEGEETQEKLILHAARQRSLVAEGC